jgi:ElaB/YqjD/DUF883 family membrane-anchored ribosome-binding protein
MGPQAKPQATTFSNDTLTRKTDALKTAAADLAGGIKDTVRLHIVQTGGKADTYVRSHPGRFIAVAACAGLAAGWLLSLRFRNGRNTD